MDCKRQEAKRLGTGLQIRLSGFDSRLAVHFFTKIFSGKKTTGGRQILESWTVVAKTASCIALYGLFDPYPMESYHRSYAIFTEGDQECLSKSWGYFDFRL